MIRPWLGRRIVVPSGSSMIVMAGVKAAVAAPVAEAAVQAQEVVRPQALEECEEEGETHREAHW